MKDNRFFLLGRDMAVDLGTANTLVYVRGRGIILNEPSVVAVNVKDGRPLAVGGRGQADDRSDTQSYPGHPSPEPRGHRRFRDLRKDAPALHPAGPPASVRQAPDGHPRPVRDHRGGTARQMEAAEYAGARKAYIIEEPMAAAIGAGLPVHEPTGNMVVDIGGGTTEVAVISLAASSPVSRSGSGATNSTRPSSRSSKRSTASPSGNGLRRRSRSAWVRPSPSKKNCTPRSAVVTLSPDCPRRWWSPPRDPPGHRRTGVGHHRRREGDTGQDAAGTGGRHHGTGHRLTGGGAAARARRPTAGGDGHAHRGGPGSR